MGAPSTGGTAKNPKTPETLENPEHPERTKPLPGAGEVVPSGTDTSATEPDGNTPETGTSPDTDGTETRDNTLKSADPQPTDPQPADCTDYARPLKLLARAIEFTDPFSGLKRRFESTRAL